MENGRIRAGRLFRPFLAGALALGCGWGCSGNRVEPVDATAARQALRSTLESWKKGEPIGSMPGHSPSVVAQDLDWEAGLSLVGFDLLGEGADEAVNLRVPVALTLRDGSGSEVKKKVKYIIGTSPVITVFREIF